MKSGGAWASRLWQKLDMPADLLPIYPQIGFTRNEATIYGHNGIGFYTKQQIRIRIRGGYVVVSGEHLAIERMNPNRLQIAGEIKAVVLEESV